jgi:2-oxoisovalerate dehydrogenase E2 component (dihydrolipoyl transacylase)
VINQPEVAIIGVNRIAIRPQWQDNQFVPRKMMNLSSSFDHRMVDGYEAAAFIRRIRQLLEVPATLFIEV